MRRGLLVAVLAASACQPATEAGKPAPTPDAPRVAVEPFPRSPDGPSVRLERVWLISNERLMFGLPNSGDITITFSCTPGSGRVRIETHNAGTDGTQLYLASGAVAERVAAVRVPPDGEWISEDEVVSIAEVGLADPVMLAFRKSGAIARGTPPDVLRTATAEELVEIETFFAFCEG